MEAILHKANTRGHTALNWLESWHTFSFGNYHDPTRMHFGALRILNDDTVAPRAGFGQHAHRNMEIITIPLQGELAHKDNLGHQQIIRQGDVQVMSAGKGIIHAEKNATDNVFVKFLQIWVVPAQKNVTPRYEQQTFSEADMQNNFVTVVAPMGSEAGVTIYQDAWFSMGNLEAGVTVDYKWHKSENGLYLFVLEGDVMADEFALNRRDGLGLLTRNKVSVKAESNASVLIMEVPMIGES